MIEYLTNLLSFLPADIAHYAAIMIWTLIKIVIIIVPVLISVAYLTYAERKVIGFMQVRTGPNRVGPKGLFQPFADAIKLMTKEVIVPANASRFLFLSAPILALAPALAMWAVIPFTDTLVLANINAGLLYVLALTSLGVYGIIIAGWASNSKYALLGAMRAAAQIVAYEIAMGFALIGVLMCSGSLNLGDIVQAQRDYWFVWPLFGLCIVYFIAGVAETNRAPFDVAEGESEIVAGFHVEYSGMAFSVFFLAEYANMIMIATLTTIMFMGGWLSPFAWLIELLGAEGIYDVPLLGALIGEGLHWFLIKTSFFLFCFLWFRATFPRYRYDQVMRLGWKVLIPVTIVWLFGLGVAIALGWQPWM